MTKVTNFTKSRRALSVLLGALLLGLAVYIGMRLIGRGAGAYDFTLTDQDGRPFHLADERGHAVAIFFGYTRCPDICPATLAHLASARRAMGASGQATRVLFITVDPARDTPGRLKVYLARFDPSFVGLTGTQAQLAPVYRAYHIWYEALPKNPHQLEQLEAHTSTIWIMNGSGRPAGFADWSDSTAVLARDLQAAS